MEANMKVNPNDQQLLWIKVKEGDETALFSLYKQLYNSLFNYGFLIFKERENVEDAINQVFLELWENKDKLKSVTNVKSYLFTYLRRKLAKERALVVREKLPTVELYEASIMDYIVQLQLEEEIKENITQAINKLTERQKQLIMLRFYENLDYTEISEKTGLATQSIYNNIHQAIKFLRADLKIPTYLLLLLLRG
ncbi:RNA polymerase sigma factor [Pedobacter caeni]|uniref:RNA polymerase sigma-70 factor, ECF subfamily n=1 Tax=Pedobacter caeni TaxID=288992 RepID=A0A1M5BNY2_9SPHI|nr:sigma-70 family RNA polymerase sigma factor [Pedobacter caeni]SHF44110.1 RNA polymerase sigma-70 factor, ECF subfamily [Pedobacter caeni]